MMYEHDLVEEATHAELAFAGSPELGGPRRRRLRRPSPQEPEPARATRGSRHRLPMSGSQARPYAVAGSEPASCSMTASASATIRRTSSPAGHELVDRADALARRVALAFGVDAGVGVAAQRCSAPSCDRAPSAAPGTVAAPRGAPRSAASSRCATAAHRLAREGPADDGAVLARVRSSASL